MSWVAGAAAASGQVLLTAETLGSGSQTVAASANLIAPEDFGTLVNFWAQYGYGVADRVDVFAAYGNISVFDETQHYVAVGSSIGMLRRDRHGLDVSFFSNVSTPLTRRDQAALLFGTFALIASRPLQVGSIVVTPYGGLEAVVPAGHRARGIFTPVETLFAGIAGLAVPLNKSWTAYVEVNPGPNLRSAGVAIAVLVPRQRPAKQRTSTEGAARSHTRPNPSSGGDQAFNLDSMRRSGISQISATATYSASEIQ